MLSAGDVTFYWPGMSSFRADGTLVMRATGYEGDWRWTGERTFAPDDPNYRMWCRFRESFLASPPPLPFVSSEQLVAVRELFRRENPDLSTEAFNLAQQRTATGVGASGEIHACPRQ